MTDHEKEIAILKDRIATLEAKVIALTGQLQYPPYQSPYPLPGNH